MNSDEIACFKNYFLSSISRSIFAFVALSFFSNSVSADTCRSLYENNEYKKALPLCIEENEHFHTGYIYEQLKNCEKMKYYYGLSKNGSAKGNLGYNLLNGYAGCERDTDKAIQLLKEAVSLGRSGFAKFLGDHYSFPLDGSTKDIQKAQLYYERAFEDPVDSQWNLDRAETAFQNWRNISNSTEEMSYFLKGLKEGIFSSSTLINEKILESAKSHIIRETNLYQKMDLVLNAVELPVEFKCRLLSDYIDHSDFTKLVGSLPTKVTVKDLSDKLRPCNGQSEMFLGLTFEQGLFNPEDFVEAYRLYTISGLQGNPKAKSARERLRPQLSPDQIDLATCLAKYETKPNFFQRLRCKAGL